jgi:hypothetical protein
MKNPLGPGRVGLYTLGSFFMDQAAHFTHFWECRHAELHAYR